MKVYQSPQPPALSWCWGLHRGAYPGTGAKKYLLNSWDTLKPSCPVVGAKAETSGRMAYAEKKAADAALRASMNGQSAGRRKPPQRPNGKHPERVKIQSTPLKNIGKPRVGRTQQDTASPAEKVESPEPMIPASRLPSTMTLKLFISLVGILPGRTPAGTDFITKMGSLFLAVITQSRLIISILVT